MKGTKGEVIVGVDDSVGWGVGLGIDNGVCISGGITFEIEDESYMDPLVYLLAFQMMKNV